MRRRWMIAGAGAAIALAWGGTELALRLMPLPDGLLHPRAASVEILDRSGLPLRTLLVDEQRFERPCALDDVSPWLIDATLAAEDKRFRQHRGVDLLATARAARDAAKAGRARSGASTITQQLVKLSSPDAPRTFLTKVREMWQAGIIERHWSKAQILEAYLNRLDYGNLQIGIAAASRFYFQKPPADLSPAEAAFLAGLPKAPSRLAADIGSARERQLWVLARMRAARFLRETEWRRARDEPLHLADPARTFAAPHFVDLLLKRQGLLPAQGGPLRTTLDLPLTRRIESLLAEQLALIADQHATSGAVVVIDNRTSEVLSLAGSGDYFQPGIGQINGAWMPRSPGSTMKPFACLLALERGANPGTVVADVPTEFETPTGLYRPNNYNHRFHGPVSLRFALGNSLNVAAIKVEQLGGGPEELHRTMGRLGITTLGHPAAHYGLGLVLGNGEVRLLELANAYATVARGGTYRPFRLVSRDTGREDSGERIFDPRACWLVADMLSDNSARSSAFGWNSHLRFDFPVACKTGTSSDYRDNWTVGFTPEFTVAVWIGNPDGSPMRGITGVTGAAPVMHEVMEHLHRTRGTSAFVEPPGVEEHWIEPLTGLRVSSTRPGATLERCLWPPEPEHSSDRDATGRVVLGVEYAAWLASPQNGLGNLVTCSPNATALRIVQPRPGATYFLDPDLPAASQRISLRAESAGKVAWTCASMDCLDGTAQLREGRHEITAHDPASGITATTWIEVRGL